MDRSQSTAGVILGTAVGDALGLPREGLSRRRAGRLFGGPPLRHRFLAGRGMTSDDTEHTCMVAQALLASRGEPVEFTRSLAWRLRGWFLAFPAGVGGATARAVLKLWLGFPPHRSGVRSAGNGPAMRAALLGVCASDREHLKALVRASTRLTHTDPAAEQGALLVALAARWGAAHGPQSVILDDFERDARQDVCERGLLESLEVARGCLAGGADAEGFAAEMGLHRGVSGYVNHTVPVAIYCWLRWPGDFRAAVEAAATAGGDADTVAAIVGGLVGATCGADAIPGHWLGGLAEWPRSVGWMRRLSGRVAAASEDWPASAGRALPLFWPGLLPRNLLFLAVVLLHGLRRLLPPY